MKGIFSFLTKDYRKYSEKAIQNFNTGNYFESIQLLNKAIMLNPSVPDLYYGRGRSKLHFEDYSGAILDLNNAIEIDSKYELACLIYRGAAKFNLGLLIASINDFSRAIELDPIYVDAYIRRGRVKLELKDYAGAINDFDKVIAMVPNNAEAYKYRGDAKFTRGDKEGAIKDYTTAVGINPYYAIRSQKIAYLTGSVYYDMFGPIESRSNPAEKIAEMEKIINIYPNNAGAYFKKGKAILKTGNRHGQLAMNDFSKAIEIEPNFANAYLERYTIKLFLGDISGSELDLAKGSWLKHNIL